MLLITQMSYLCHLWQHAYNLNILASIIQLDLHYWPSRAPFIRDEEREQSATSCEGWLADWVSQHCRTNHHTGNALEPLGTWCSGDREWWGVGLSGQGETNLFFFFKKSYPTFVPRENEIPIKTGDTGNFVSAWFLLLWLQGKGEESGVTRFQAKMRKKASSFQGFLLLSQG